MGESKPDSVLIWVCCFQYILFTFKSLSSQWIKNLFLLFKENNNRKDGHFGFLPMELSFSLLEMWYSLCAYKDVEFLLVF